MAMELDPPQRREAESKTFLEKMQTQVAKPGRVLTFGVPDPGPATIKQL